MGHGEQALCCFWVGIWQLLSPEGCRSSGQLQSLTHEPQDSCHPSTRALRLSSPFQALLLSLFFFFPTAQSLWFATHRQKHREMRSPISVSGSLRRGKASGHTINGRWGPHMPYARCQDLLTRLWSLLTWTETGAVAGCPPGSSPSSQGTCSTVLCSLTD